VKSKEREEGKIRAKKDGVKGVKNVLTDVGNPAFGSNQEWNKLQGEAGKGGVEGGEVYLELEKMQEMHEERGKGRRR